jgi:putative redox protein
MEIDKSKELVSKITLINNRLNFIGNVEGNEPVSIDYTPPLGDNLGYTSLELFLLSLSSCIGSAVLTFLRKMRKTLTGFEVRAKGIRKEDHPTAFKEIFIEINLEATDVSDDDMKKVLKLSEDTYCPVWAMIKGNVEMNVKFNVTCGKVLSSLEE